VLLPQPLGGVLAVRPFDEDRPAVGELEDEAAVPGEPAVNRLAPDRRRAERALDDLSELRRG
jgi:hypothetical protein